ncbi:hypothetical protein [Pannonibacter indicus]|uniref:hypothetical protein n=1 Tax=Pannonibacter indicus TaxID=466044 RepID=UPI0035B4CB46
MMITIQPPFARLCPIVPASAADWRIWQKLCSYYGWYFYGFWAKSKDKLPSKQNACFPAACRPETLPIKKQRTACRPE